jgi:hypothetical protein
MKLETDNSFSITIINSTMGNDTGNNNTLSSDSSTEELFNKQKYIDNGFKVEDYDDGSYAGIKVIAEFASIDSVSDPSIDIIELTELVNNKVEDIKLFKSEKVENGTKYTANFTYNLDDDSLKDATSSYNVDISSYGDIMELEYSITLPYKLENENSTSHSGNTYKWKLTFGEVNIIKFSFIVKDEDITDEKNEYEEGTESKGEAIEVTVTEGGGDMGDMPGEPPEGMDNPPGGDGNTPPEPPEGKDGNRPEKPGEKSDGNSDAPPEKPDESN